MSKHTPTPWRYEPATKTIRAVPANYWIATVNSWDGMVNNEADGEFIALAVNNHAGLVASLTAVSAALADHITREARAKEVTPENLCPCSTTDLKAALILLYTIKAAKGEA